MLRNLTVVVLLSLFSFILFASCQSSSQALQLIERYKCRDCHTLKGKGGASAPNLTAVGSRHDRAFIFQQIKAPKSHNPNSDMPTFGDRMSEQEIGVIADYLAGLK